MTDTRERNYPTLYNTPEHMTALSILGAVCTQTLSLQLGYSAQTHAKMMVPKVSVTTQWLVQQKDKDAQRSCAIAVDIAGALSK